MIFVVNELSYSQSESVNQAKTWYDNFFQLCIKFEKEYATKLNLKFSTSLIDYNFHQNFIFKQWLSVQKKDEKSSILSMLTKEPIIHEYPYYKAYGIEGKGIGYAFENDEFLISFETSINWTVDYILVLQEQIIEETLEIETDEFNLRNYYFKDNLECHNKYVLTKLSTEKKNVLSGVSSGVDIWNKRNDLFPNLLFCDSTEQFIKSSTGDFLKNILKKFKEYDTYFSKWKDGDFEKESLSGDVRLESETRINKFNNQLTITCPDGRNRLFSLHCNIGIWGFRMHFFPDIDSRKCIIGYVGKKII